MEAALQIERKPTRLAASGRFGNFRPENENVVRAPKVESNLAIEGMGEAWKRCAGIIPNDQGASYTAMLIEISGLEYSAQDVEVFSVMLSKFQEEKRFSERAGLFLSALVNNCQEEKFIIRSAHLSMPIDNLGHHNTKRIIVEGDVGDFLGDEMGCGRIIVNGNAGFGVGAGMKGGVLLVNGNADQVGMGLEGGSIIVEGDVCDAGSLMDGGIITVWGNATHLVGSQMTGGEIHLFGTFVLADDIRRGKIFHKDELIFPK